MIFTLAVLEEIASTYSRQLQPDYETLIRSILYDWPEGKPEDAHNLVDSKKELWELEWQDMRKLYFRCMDPAEST